MKKPIFGLLFMVTLLSMLITGNIYAEEAPKESPTVAPQVAPKQEDRPLSSIKERISESQKSMTTDQIEEKLERKGNELFSIAKSASVLQIGIVALIFVLLLIVGIFVKALRAIAFSVLVLGILGYFIINFLPDILNIIKTRIIG